MRNLAAIDEEDAAAYLNVPTNSSRSECGFRFSVIGSFFLVAAVVLGLVTAAL
jgi:hypothetical protein